ncbi:MAG: response regulator [Bacteroidia bacterium]
MAEDEKPPIIHLLLADDDEDDRNLFKETIIEIGLNVELSTVKDGFQLMHALSEAEWLPDVIFLDLNMPYKGGTECLTEIRANKKLKHIPVVIFSTSGNEKDIIETYNKGANLYLRKPTDYNVQKHIFRKILAINWKEFMPHSSKENFIVNEKSPWIV